MSDSADIIYALASAPGRAGLSVVRVSGPGSLGVCSVLYDREVEFRTPSVRVLRNIFDDEIIDEAIVLAFKGGASFTGEETVEFHCHGSISVVQTLLDTLSKLEGTRAAGAGEFTRRALENGRLDLTQVEGLGDLIASETTAQRKQALRIMQGELREKVEHWRSSLVEAASLLEVMIDFSDEELPDGLQVRIRDIVEELIDSFRTEISGSIASERVRDGFEVALIGEPNIGKSTLLNRIAGRDVAITSDIAGTTRDVIEVHLEIEGIAVTILDTAGIRDSSDYLEGIGVSRTRARAESADLRVFLIDGKGDANDLGFRDGDIVVKAKADLLSKEVPAAVSGKTGAGIDELLEQISIRLQDRVSGASSLTRLRHRKSISGALDCLERAAVMLEDGSEVLDLIGEELRTCLRDLDEVIGRVNVEGLLDSIFSSFCIGK